MIKKRSVDADSSSRLFAYVLDWAIGGILTGLPAVVMYAMITKRDDMFSDLYVFEALGFNKYIGIVAGLLCFVVAILYFIVIPYKKFNGQTLGKKLTKIKIESVDGTEVSLKQYMIRYCIIFIFECPMFIISTYIMQMMTILIRFEVESVWRFVGVGVTILSAALVVYRKDHRALHDLLANTRVVKES